MSSGPERFNLLASAVAGRPLEVAPVEPARSQSWTDGATVFIDVDATEREQILSLAVHASLLACGSLDSEHVAALTRRPALVRRYLAVEGPRALATNRRFLPAAARPTVDPRLPPRSASPGESLAIAMSNETLPDPPQAFGTIRPRRLRPGLGVQGASSGTEHHAPRRADPDLLQELDDDEDGGGRLFDAASSPVGGGGSIGRLIKKLLGDARSGEGGPPGADAGTHRSHRSQRGANGSSFARPSTAVATIEDVALPVARRESTYPEWDVHRRRYRPNWCTVRELEQAPPKLAPFESPRTDALRRALAPLGREWERRPRQLQGIDVDIDAAVAALVDIVSGSSPNEEVYVDVLRKHRDLAVLVLLDISGSSGEPSPSGGTVHEHQRTAAAALVVALRDLGDRVGLYSFRSQGRSEVHVVPMKRFDERLDTAVMHRIGGSFPAAYTRLGAGIRHASTVLEREGGTTRRLLVVLSDGFAYDHGYEGRYGQADARRALAEARRRGVGCVCLSVGAATDTESLRRVFGSAAHARIPVPDRLHAVVGPLFRFALKSAEAQRRSFERKMRTSERLELEGRVERRVEGRTA